MGKLIDLHPSSLEWMERGKRILKNLSKEDGSAVISVIFAHVIEDVQRGIAGSKENNPAFDVINKIIQTAAGQCYFCNKKIDPNETEFNRDTHLCLFCMLKVANILEACGVDPQKLFPKIGKREVQKTKIF